MILIDKRELPIGSINWIWQYCGTGQFCLSSLKYHAFSVYSGYAKLLAFNEDLENEEMAMIRCNSVRSATHLVRN